MKPVGEMSMRERSTLLAAAFAAGFLETSRTAFFGMCAGVVLMLAIAGWYFSYETLGGPEGAYLARSSRDSYGLATSAALAAARLPPDRPRLILLGTSATGAAFAREEPLERALEAALAEGWAAVILATALQSPLDQFALIERALGSAPGPSAPVVIAIGYSAFADGWTTDRMIELESLRRLGLRSDWEDEETRRIGGEPQPRSRFYVVENARFVAVNGGKALMRLLARFPAKRRFDMYAPRARTRATTAHRDQLAERYRNAREHMRARGSSPARESLRHLARRLDAYPSVMLVIIGEALNPAFVAANGLEVEQAAFRREMAAFAASIGASYWPIHSETKTPPGAYNDILHIGAPAAEEKLRRTLVTHVAALIGNER